MNKKSHESKTFQEICLLEMLLEQKRQGLLLGVIMTKVTELTAILSEVKENLDEASTELTSKIDTLTAELSSMQNLSPEAEDMLSSIRASAKSLADIVPNAEPAPEPAPENQPLEGSIIDNGVQADPAIDPETGLPVEQPALEPEIDPNTGLPVEPANPEAA